MTYKVLDSSLFGSRTYSSYSITETYEDGVQGKIRSFGELPDGWDFGAGRASPPGVVEEARKIYQLGKSLGLEADAFPGLDGEISVAFYAQEHTVEVRVNTDLSLDLVHEIGIGVDYQQSPYIKPVETNFIASYLTLLVQQVRVWNSSGLSILQDMIQGGNGSRVIPFPTGAAPFQFLTQSAPNLLQLAVYAHT